MMISCIILLPLSSLIIKGNIVHSLSQVKILSRFMDILHSSMNTI